MQLWEGNFPGTMFRGIPGVYQFASSNKYTGDIHPMNVSSPETTLYEEQ